MIPLLPLSTLFPYTTLFRSLLKCFSLQLIDKTNSKYINTRGIVFLDRKSTRLNSSHVSISYAVFCLKKKKNISRFILINDYIDESTVNISMYSENTDSGRYY